MTSTNEHQLYSPPGAAGESGRHRVRVITPLRVLAAVLLIAPFVALLSVGSYARTTPVVGGVPFFYWYQMLWVVLAALFAAVASWLIRRDENRHAQQGDPK
jgi:hypothetical protein